MGSTKKWIGIGSAAASTAVTCSHGKDELGRLGDAANASMMVKKLEKQYLTW
jgi:hypothetical protein